jgi:hypothetical protein
MNILLSVSAPIHLLSESAYFQSTSGRDLAHVKPEFQVLARESGLSFVVPIQKLSCVVIFFRLLSFG